jgi:hypothetical protein
MKRTILLLAVAVVLAAFTAPVLAQSTDCTDENKAAWYQKFLDNRKGEQKIAYDNAKLYLKCSTDPAEQITSYLQKWVDQYEKLMGTQQVAQQFEEAYKQKKYADQIRLGPQVLAADPDNSAVQIIMGLAGLGDPSLISQSAEAAKKAITMVEGGKPFAPLASKDQALAYLNYVVAKSIIKNAPADAIPYLLKTVRYDSDLKKNPQVYAELAGAYGEGPIAKLSEEYKAKYTTESPESKLALANINQMIDRQIDALARAAALSADAANKKAVMDVLTGLYTDRNKSAAGLNEMIASILTKPVPDIPTPLTSLPTPAPSSTPGTAGSGGAQNGAAGNGATGSAKPAPSPTPSAKKPH